MNNTNYDRIKNMSLDEMTKFFTDLVHTDIITTADHYICKKCKEEHNGECPMGDDDNCLYDNSDYVTVKLWLTGDMDRAERTKTIVEELRAKPSRDNRNLLDRAADRIEELEANLKQSQGEWIDRYNNDFANPIYMCSVCGKGTLLKPHIDELDNMVMVQALSPFCPNCGAKMKGGAE